MYTVFRSLLDSHAGPRQRTRNPRQRLCQGLPSAKTPRGIFRRRRGLCWGPFIGHSAKPAKKRSHHAPAPLAVSLPRADPRQRNGYFLNFFAEGRPSAKKFSGFFPKKPLPRAIARALGKRFFFKKNCLPRAGPRQRNIFFLNFFLKSLPRACSLALGKEIFRIFKKNLCRGLLLGPSAKGPSLPRALVIALGKETEI